MSREPSLAEQAEHRELAALVDGPWAPCWLWRDALEATHASSRRMGHPDDHPAAAFRHYRPTDDWIKHNPIEEGVTGRAWRYQPPRSAERLH